MDAVVQLIRNALCCVKDLNLFGETSLYDPKVSAQFLQKLNITLPSPLDEATPLELLICPTQFFAFVSLSRAGFNLITHNGYFKLQRINRIIEMRSSGKKASSSPAETIVDENLKKARTAAKRTLFMGILILPLGISFFWLAANSLHITETDWIGGLQALIHALTVMEVALLPLLYWMLEDAAGNFARARRMMDLTKVLRTCRGHLPKSAFDAETFSWIHGGWNPFWNTPVDSLGEIKKYNPIAEAKKVSSELSKVQATLDHTMSSKSVDKVDEMIAHDLEEIADRLESEASVARMEGYREYLYFLFNFIAFYGYLLGILVYYFEDEELQPYFVSQMKLGYSHADADWHGNFAGDFMWTVEPIVILSSPMFFGLMKAKVKVKKE